MNGKLYIDCNKGDDDDITGGPQSYSSVISAIVTPGSTMSALNKAFIFEENTSNTVDSTIYNSTDTSIIPSRVAMFTSVGKSIAV